MFQTVLIANRGEIACRVIATLHKLGIRAVAIFSEADSEAKHVQLADAAVCVGPASASESYLNIANIIAAAKQTGAEAVHPGYGFLAESAAFAQACEDAGIVFLGPSSAAIDVMGDKIRAKRQVESRQVPTVPGAAETDRTAEEFVEDALAVGFPLLIKPSAGGGGKGMHVVRSREELLAKIPQAKREALASFGNDELLVERYVENPRHIEVQVIADSHGAVVHLGERECSLQRRHQKVIEEAPSPLLTAATRARIGEAACETARSVGYRGAGTVEFIVGADNPDEFFFIEMNTRLQVEHPVTEMVTGIDLVEWQVRVGAGEALGFAQSDIVLRGHAIEARVYAEDVPAGFLPSGGRVLELHEASGEGIRVDSALVEGQRVSSDYDPMLAKVIAWASDRAGALATAQQALSQTSVFGVTTNIEFLSRLLDHPAVQRGELDTGLIERELDLLVPPEASDEALIAAALELRARSSRAIANSATISGPWRSLSGFRIGQQAPAVFVFEVDAAADGASPATRQRRLAVWDANRGRVPGASGHSTESFRVRIDDGDDQEVTVFRDENLPGRVTIRVNDSVASWRVRADDKGVWVQRGTQVARLDLARRDVGALAGSDAVPELRSPMPGTVVQLAVADGDHVEAGDTIVVVEAMKMEHVLAAHAAGVVRLHATLGASVERHAVLATLEIDSDPKDIDPKDSDPKGSGSKGSEAKHSDQQDSAESGSNDSKNETAEQGQQ